MRWLKARKPKKAVSADAMLIVAEFRLGKGCRHGKQQRGRLEVRETILDPDADAERAQVVVRAWLERFGYSAEDSDPGDNHSWSLLAHSLNEAPDSFVVGWLPAWNALQVQIVVGVTDATQLAFKMMSPASQMAFVSDVSSCLNDKYLDFGFIGPENATITQASRSDDGVHSFPPPQKVIMVGRVIVDRPVYRSDFFVLYRRVAAAARNVSHMFDKMGVRRRWT